MNEIEISNKKYSSFFKSKVFFLVLSIWIISLVLRFSVYDSEIPIFMDSLKSFSYAVDIHVLGGLPENYTVTKHGWSVFLAGLFHIFDFNETMSYMQIQRVSSIVISSLTIFPLYFLCNRFVEAKYSIIGIALFGFAPRLIENSLYGTGDPLFILLFVTTVLFFLNTSKKLVYLSFVLSGICTIIRPEGIFLFFAIFLMLIFKLKKENIKIPKYLFAGFLFLLIVMPFVMHNEEITPGQSVFSRIIHTSDKYFDSSNEDSNAMLNEQLTKQSPGISIFTGLENFPKYLGWVMIPMFIITAPIGFILFIKNLSYNRITIIVIAVVMSIPAFYAYSYPIPETKYLYSLLPLFCIFSILPLKLFIEKFQKKNILIAIIIAILILTSVLFYNYKVDSEHERESVLIAKKIIENNMAINDYYPESDYIRGLEVDKRWTDFKSFHENIERTNPDGTLRTMEYNFLPQKIKVVSLINEFGIDDSDKFDSIESFILEHDKQLTHLIVDTMDHRPNFLKDVFYNEQNYSYLIKEWDSKNDGFTYHVKIFKINYELFNSKIHGEQLP